MPHARHVAAVAVFWLAAVLLLPLVGCGATVVHPPVDVSDPVSVFIADYGKHSSLLLPRADGASVEFAYGEWRWFAAGETGFWRVPGVLLGSHPGALGRRELGILETNDPEALAALLGFETAHRIDVERRLANELLLKLDAACAAGDADSLFNRENGLTFVHDPRPYSMSFHCNTVTAQWLRELGCDVGDAGFVANFRIVPREPANQATPPAPGQ